MKSQITPLVELLTPSDVARLLRRKVSGVYKSIAAADDTLPPHAKIGGRVYFHPTAVIEWQRKKFHLGSDNPEGGSRE